VWRGLLETIFLTGVRKRVSSNIRDLSLRAPLGPWLANTDAFRLHWDAFYSPAQTALFLATNDGRYTRHTARRTCRRPKDPARAFARQPIDTVYALVPNAVPTEHTFETNKIVIPHRVSTLALPLPVAPTPLRWPEYIALLPPWEQALLSTVALMDHPTLFAAL
jgi:hypothetical protein